MAKKMQAAPQALKHNSRFAARGRKRGIFTSKMALRVPSELVKIVGIGVPVSDAKKLYIRYKVDEKEVGGYVSGSLVKFKRHKAGGRLSPEESDRLIRLARLMAAAEALHDGDADAARRWMESPAPALGGVAPLAYARSEVGAREVESLIGRLEHGVFS